MRAEAANARLRKVFPEGYALDATHRPHITMLQRFVRTADLDKVYAAVGDVLAGEKPAGWTLEAFKYDYVVWDKAGVTVILIKPTDQLIQFQQKLIDAIAPFTVETGTAAAFFTTPEHPDINQPTIDYVTHYVPDSSGKKLVPHVTVGVAPPDYLKKIGRRTVRCVHVLAGGVVGLSARQFRNGSEETQGVAVETVELRESSQFVRTRPSALRRHPPTERHPPRRAALISASPTRSGDQRLSSTL